jgi:SAM-dependent methyltransferase
MAWTVRTVSGAVDYCRFDLLSRLHDHLFFIGASVGKALSEKPTKVMVNIGAGKWHQKGWKVLDYSGKWYRYQRLFLDYSCDMMTTKRLPFNDESVFLFFSEHVLEHLPDDRVQFILGELHRALRSGGGLRIVVPDAELIYERFRAKEESFFHDWMFEKDATLEEVFLILIAHPRQPFEETELWEDLFRLPRDAFLDKLTKRLKYDYARAGEHINWFSYDKLRRMLTSAGFDRVYRSEPQQSRMQEIRGPAFDTRPSWSLHVDALR